MVKAGEASGALDAALALVLGGAVENLIDRLLRTDGGVMDFIEFTTPPGTGRRPTSRSPPSASAP